MNRSSNARPGGQKKEEPLEQDEEDMLLLNLENITAATRSVAAPIKPHDKKRALPKSTLEKDNLRTQIAMIRAQREMANKAHEKEVQEKEQRIRLLRARIKMLRKDFHKHAAVHQYAAELKDENVPSYIVVLQAKLCREVHHMCVDEAQLKLSKRIAGKLAKFANKQVMDLEQERSLLEVQVLNSMAQLEVQQKELQQEYSEKVREQRMAVVDIQKEIGQESWEEESGIDNIMDRLSMLNTKLKHQTEPQDELTLDDLKKDREDSNHSLDDMLASGEKALHNSWNAPFTKDKHVKATRRGSGMFGGAKTWQSEKVWK